MSSGRKLRLAFIIIVEGVLLCNSQPVRASREVVEKVKDLDTFTTYPWGRESFQLTLQMVKFGNHNKNVKELADKIQPISHYYTWLYPCLPTVVSPRCSYIAETSS
ncbi:unnamed protein product [Cochlearia groenlandica]